MKRKEDAKNRKIREEKRKAKVRDLFRNIKNSTLTHNRVAVV